MTCACAAQYTLSDGETNDNEAMRAAPESRILHVTREVVRRNNDTSVDTSAEINLMVISDHLVDAVDENVYSIRVCFLCRF